MTPKHNRYQNSTLRLSKRLFSVEKKEWDHLTLNMLFPPILSRSTFILALTFSIPSKGGIPSGRNSQLLIASSRFAAAVLAEG